MNNIRKACVEAVLDEIEEHGDAVRPLAGEKWDDVHTDRFLGRVTGSLDIAVADLVDIIIDTINKESWT